MDGWERQLHALAALTFIIIIIIIIGTRAFKFAR